LAPTDAAFLAVMGQVNIQSAADSFVVQRAVVGDGGVNTYVANAIIPRDAAHVGLTRLMRARSLSGDAATRDGVSGSPRHVLTSLAPLERSTLQVFGRLRFPEGEIWCEPHAQLGELDARTGTGTPTQ
jgi:hypothetical protein